MVKLYTKFVSLILALCVSLAAYSEEVNDTTANSTNEQIKQLQSTIESLQAQITQNRIEIEADKQELAAKESAAKENSLYTPQVFGTVMATFNLSTYNDMMRFNVRNSRFGLKGLASKHLSYAVQIDFHNQGSVSVLDSYICYKQSNFQFKFGQQQIHLTSDLSRGPSSNLFTTRSYSAIYSTSYYVTNSDGSQSIKSIGSRDIGAYAIYKFDQMATPLTLSFGVFNGTGINTPTWDNSLNVVGRLTIGAEKKGLFGGVSYYTGETALRQSIEIISAEMRYQNKTVFVEGSLQRRNLEYNGTQNLTLAYIQGYYNFLTPKSKAFEYPRGASDQHHRADDG